MAVLLVGSGGFIGSVLRYWLSGIAQALSPRAAFPLGTLVVNVTGCLVIGALAALAETRGMGAGARAFLLVGVLGGYTTFSTFANDTVTAVRVGHALAAGVNVIASVVGCLAAVWAGRALAGAFLT
jgi:CrcB protein